MKFNFRNFSAALVGGGLVVLLVWALGLKPLEEVLSFGIPLLFAFAMGVGVASKD